MEDDALLGLAALPVFVVQRRRLGDIAGSVLPHPEEWGRGLAGWKGASGGAGRGREAPEEEAHVGEQRLHQADGAEGRTGGVEVHFVLIRAGGLEAVLGAGGAVGGRGCELEQRLPGCRESTRSQELLKLLPKSSIPCAVGTAARHRAAREARLVLEARF